MATNQKNVKMKFKEVKMLEEVVKILIERPDKTARETADELKITLEAVVGYYSTIKADKTLQDKIINQSKYPRFAKETAWTIEGRAKYFNELLMGKKWFPLILEIHPGAFCQCSCTFCFSHRREYNELLEGKEVTSKEVMTKALKTCADNGVEAIWFSGGKEPLLNENTLYYMTLANQLGMRTRVYTNGILLNEKARKVLINCEQVRISLNGAIYTTYNAIQFPKTNAYVINQAFPRILENIKELVRLKKATNSKVAIGISQILQPRNFEEISEFVNLGKNLGVDSVHFRLENTGMVRDFHDDEKDKIMEMMTKVLANEKEIIIDARGIAEGELYSRNEQFLPGLKAPDKCYAGLVKRGLNPYSGVYNCEFSSHPMFSTPGDVLKIGDLSYNDIDFIFKNAVKRFPSPLCKYCQANEYGLNIALAKFKTDLADGIKIEQQPYYKEK